MSDTLNDFAVDCNQKHTKNVKFCDEPLFFADFDPSQKRSFGTVNACQGDRKQKIYRDHVGTQRRLAKNKHLNLIGLMVKDQDSGHIFNTLNKSWHRSSIQDRIQLAQAFRVEIILGYEGPHPYGYYYTNRLDLGAEGLYIPLNEKAVSKKTCHLEKLGMIEKGFHKLRPTANQVQASNGTKNLTRRVCAYRPNFRGILKLAKETIHKHGLESSFTSPYSDGLDDTLIFSAIFGVENFAWLTKVAREIDLPEFESRLRSEAIIENTNVTKMQKSDVLEAAQEAALRPFPCGPILPSDIITSNEVSYINKLSKTFPSDEVEDFKKNSLDEGEGLVSWKRKPGGIKSFLAAYTRKVELPEPTEDLNAPFVDLVITSEPPELPEPTFEDVKGVLRNMAKTMRKRSMWQPDVNTQLARNWRAEMSGVRQPRNTSVKVTDELRGRYRVLESIQTHEKAPPEAKNDQTHSRVPGRLENALQGLLNASTQEKHKEPNPKPVECLSQPIVVETEEDRLIRERYEAKRQLLGLK